MPNLKGRRHFSPAASAHGDGRTRPRPTTDLLRLYTKMRDLGEGISFEDLLQLREDPTAQNSHLLPPTPDATSMSRSTSCTSSYSIGQAIDNLDITDTQPQEDNRRKLGRHGPLTLFAKARTAFVRKLKACSTCHSRKVKCTHHDLSLFEAEYNRSKGIQTSSADRVIPPPPAVWTGIQENTSLATDLLFVGTAPTSIPEANRTLVDFDHLLSPSSPSSTAQVPHPSPTAGRIGTGNSYFLVHHHGSHTVGEGQDTPIPIGREVTTGSNGWECRGIDLSDAAATCLQRFPTIAELNMHFRMFHSPFRELSPPYLYNCMICGFLNDIPSGCFQCEASEDALERWYFGRVQQPSSLTASPLEQALQSHSSSLSSVSQQFDQSSHGLHTADGNSHDFSGLGLGWSASRNFGPYSMSGRCHEPELASLATRSKVISSSVDHVVQLWPVISAIRQQYPSLAIARLAGQSIVSLVRNNITLLLKHILCYFVIVVSLFRVPFPSSAYPFPATSDVGVVALLGIISTAWLVGHFRIYMHKRHVSRMRLPSHVQGNG